MDQYQNESDLFLPFNVLLTVFLYTSNPGLLLKNYSKKMPISAIALSNGSLISS